MRLLNIERKIWRLLKSVCQSQVSIYIIDLCILAVTPYRPVWYGPDQGLDYS